MLHQLQSHARGAAGEPVDDEQQLRAHDFFGRRVALPDAVLEDQAVVERRELRALDARSLAHADPGGEPIDQLPAFEHPLDNRPAGAHSFGHDGAELDALTVPRDADELVDGE